MRTLSNKQLLALYKKMLLIRMVEETIAEKYSEKEMRCPIHLSIGQEAVAVGVCENLRTTDIIYSTHRCHAHYLAKGGDLNKMIAEIYGKETGCCGGRGGSMHLFDPEAGFGGATPIVGNSLPIAVGVAFAKKLSKKTDIVTVFIGDGTMEEGVTHESLNFASLHALPILFICENNSYSVYSHLSVRQPFRKIIRLAQAHAVSAKSYDGSDVGNVFQVTEEAVQYVRSGKGPVFLEFSSYRWREHCGPNYDDDLNYRDAKETKHWLAKDSIVSLENVLRRRGLLSLSSIARTKQIITNLIQEAFQFAQKSQFPKKTSLHDHVYA